MSKLNITPIGSRDELVAERFRLAIDYLGVSQYKLAKVLHCTRNVIANYIVNRTPLPSHVALRFCDYYLIDEHWLATGEGEKAPGFITRPGVALLRSPKSLCDINAAGSYGTTYVTSLYPVYKFMSLAPAAQSLINRVKNANGDLDRLRVILNSLLDIAADAQTSEPLGLLSADIAEATIKFINKQQNKG